MADGQQADYHDRVRRAQAEMARQGVDALAIGVGSDLSTSRAIRRTTASD